MELDDAVIRTVNKLVDNVVLANVKNQRARNEDSQSLCLVIETSSTEGSANNSPLPLQNTGTKPMLFQEKIDNENLKSDGQTIDERKDKNDKYIESMPIINVKQQLNRKLPTTAIVQSMKKSTSPSSSNQAIKLKLMSLQPSPIPKILPKSSKPKKLNETIIDPVAKKYSATTTKQALQATQIPQCEKQISSNLTAHMDAKSTIIVPTFTTNTTLSNACSSNKTENKATSTHLHSSTELPIKPRVSQQPVVLTTFITTATTPLVHPINKTTSPATTTTTTYSTVPDASTMSSVDLFAITVDKIAAGTEISPNQEEKIAPSGAQFKTKPKKKATSKANNNGDNNAKEKTFLNPLGSQNTNIVPLIPANNALSDSLPNANNIAPTSGIPFPSNQPFTLATNANFGGGAYYIIRQQPNATNQFIPVTPQLFLSSMQPVVDSTKDPTTSMAANQSTNQSETKQHQQKTSVTSQLMSSNILYRSAGNNTIFMPTMIPSSMTSQNAVSHQMPIQVGITNGQQQKNFQNKSTITPTILPKSAHPNNKNSVVTTLESNKISISPQQVATAISTSNHFFIPSGQQGRFVQVTSIPSNNITIREQLQQQANLLHQNTETNEMGSMSANELKINSPLKPRRKKKQEKIKGSPSSHLKQMPTLEANGQIVDEEENEPPPVLCRDELTGTQSLDSLFQKEAKIIRMKMFDDNGKKVGPLKHFIDGFEIEEDIEPFPCEHQKLLNQLRENSPEKNNSLKSPIEAQSSSSETKDDKANNKNIFSKQRRHKRTRKYSSSSENFLSASPDKEKGADLSLSQSPKRPTKKGRRREIEGLLKMDFGPGKTPFPTSDPDEYAEEVFIEVSKQQRTLALAAEERNTRRSVERSCSSTKTTKREKEKIGNTQISNDGKPKQEKKTSNAKPDLKNENSIDSTSVSELVNDDTDKNNKKFSREIELDDGNCSYCKKSFKEVGRDNEHNQYCSKECRKQKKQLKKLKSTSMDSNMTTNGERNTPNRRSDLTTPGTSAEITVSPQKMTSPLGSAFSAVQPQMITNGGRTPIISGALKRKWTVDEQAAQLAAAQQQQIAGGQFTGPLHGSFEFGTSPPQRSDQIFLNSQQQQLQMPTPTLHSHQQVVMPIPFQNQYPPPHMHPYTFSQDNMHFIQHTTSQQQMNTPIMIPAPANFFPNSFRMIASQQQPQSSGIRQSPHIQSPATPITPIEKNVEIETLMARSIQSWTCAEVAKWVNFITNSDSIGEIFVQQDVDGGALILLTCEDFQKELKLKLGPAVKLNNALNALRSKPPNG